MSEISLTENLKELLANPNQKIKLHDFVFGHVRKFMEAADVKNFPVQTTPPSKETFIERLQKYEDISKDLQTIVILLAKWGDQEQLKLLEHVFMRITEVNRGSEGNVFLINFSWYPIEFLMYSAGIASLHAHKLGALKITLETLVPYESTNETPKPIVIYTEGKMAGTNDGFKWLSGHENNHTPKSEYLLKKLQPIIENLLFVGKSYESLFDRYEVYMALSYANASARLWGPPGRFGWKHSRSIRQNDPFMEVYEEIKKEDKNWVPLKFGFFGGSTERAIEVIEAYKSTLDEISWF